MPKVELTNMVMIQDKTTGKVLETTNDFRNYLPMFFEDGLNEAFGSWNNDEPWEIVYK